MKIIKLLFILAISFGIFESLAMEDQSEIFNSASAVKDEHSFEADSDMEQNPQKRKLDQIADG